MNRGVIIKKQKRDYIAGQETGIKYEVTNESGDWTEFLPTNETQYLKIFDTMSCVTFSAHNLIETAISQKIAKKTISDEAIKKLKEWGFFDENGKFNCSDRFTAKMSGTTKKGNTLQAVWDSIRKNGLVPESMWPATGVYNWDEWMKEIPQDIKDFAKNILTVLDFQYEWLVTNNCGEPNKDIIKEALKQCPLQIAAPSCPMDEDDRCHGCGSCVTQHATMIFGATNDYYMQYDSYDKYKKILCNDFVMPYILKGVVKEKTASPEPSTEQFNHAFYTNLFYGERSEEVMWLQKALIKLGYKTFATGYYGDLTAAALYEFMKKYSVTNILVLLWNKGKYFGPLTRAKMNEVLKVAK